MNSWQPINISNPAYRYDEGMTYTGEITAVKTYYGTFLKMSSVMSHEIAGVGGGLDEVSDNIHEIEGGIVMIF